MSKKTLIITGASTGIGKAIARHFLSRGHQVLMNASSAERLQAAYEELGSPAGARLLAADVSLPATGEQLVSTAVREFGHLDALVNNAGIFAPKAFLEVEEKELDSFLAVNLKGSFFCSQAAIRAMLKSGGGSIVNIGTVLVDHAIGGFPAAAPVSSKAAVHALSRQLAAEFGHANIRVNTIAPGIIRSPLQAKIGVSNADALAGLHLLNRIGEADEIAHMVDLLLNSNFITGEIMNVDGGHVAGHVFA